MSRDRTPPPSAPARYPVVELADDARARRACERWTLLEAVRRTRHQQVSAAAPRVAAGAVWWEEES